jgi:hypothetical protein
MIRRRINWAEYQPTPSAFKQCFTASHLASISARHLASISSRPAARFGPVAAGLELISEALTTYFYYVRRLTPLVGWRGLPQGLYQAQQRPAPWHLA